MRRILTLLCLLLLALPGVAAAQSCTRTGGGYACTFPPDTVVVTRHDTVRVTDTLRLYCTLAASAWACSPSKPTDPVPPPTDTVVTPPDTVTPPPVDTVKPPPPTGTNEPPGLRTIIDMDFAATKLPASFVSGPNATYGITLGKVQAPHQSNRSVPSPLGYAHRCSFGPSLVPGRGPGCYFEAKEDLAGNSSGNSVTSYRLWYETGLFKFGGANGEQSFENVGSDGFKLLGYWGGMCPGNTPSSSLILWGAPAAGRVDSQVTAVSLWRAQVRWNASCGGTTQPWKTQNFGNAPTFTAGTWHTYEVLLDAGDVGQANGSVTLWIDGVRMIRYTGVLRTASAPRGWYGRHWNPVMNGKVELRKTRVDVLDIDRVRVAVGQPVD